MKQKKARPDEGKSRRVRITGQDNAAWKLSDQEKDMMKKIAVALLLAALPSAAIAAADVVVHRDPGCGCCEKWVQAVRAKLGRKVVVLDDAGRAAFQQRAGVPKQLSSCHTAVVDGLVFEGHVPIADMQRVLAARPAGVKGLAVPGMPLGSEGMEVAGAPRQAYTVIAFGPKGQSVYARH